LASSIIPSAKQSLATHQGLSVVCTIRARLF
jgi:hypothetical protein